MPLDLARNAGFLKNGLTLAKLAKAAYADDPESSTAFGETVFETATTFADEDTKTFGFVTANDDHVVIAFRGTQNLQNWLTNIQFGMRKQGGVFVHDGFAAAVDAVWDEMIGILRDKRGSGKAVWVTGHSLGGALANWTAFWLTGPNAAAAVHTFGQPRVGDLTFRNLYDVNHHRFVNNKDIVPTVPPRTVPGRLVPPVFYSHVNTLHHFDGSGNLVEDSDDELGAQPALTEALGPLARRETTAAKLVLEGIDDHDMNNYIACLEKNQ